MMKTSDGSFVVIVYTAYEEGDFIFKRQHRMIKYNEDGNLLWTKDYDFGVSEPDDNGYGGPIPSNEILELPNGDLVMSGTYFEGDTTLFYIFRTNADGDSLAVKMHHQLDAFNNLNAYNGDVYAIDWNPLSEKVLLKFNDVGEVINEYVLGNHDIFQSIITNDGHFISARIGGVFKKFSLTGEFIGEVDYDDSDIGHISALNDLDGITAYGRDLIKLDNNLQEVWHTPIDELFVSMGNTLNYDSWAMKPTPDGGYILAGHAWYPDWADAFVYLIKVDENGTREWGGLVGPSIIRLNIIFDIEPVSDGYVLTGGNINFEELVLAKVNEMGRFTNIEEPGIDHNNELIIFPNPANEVVNINLPNYISGNIEVFDILGGLVTAFKVEHINKINFSTESFHPGFYFVQINNQSTGELLRGSFKKQ